MSIINHTTSTSSGKWLEGACYFLEDGDEPVIDQAVKELLEMISSAPWKDGYLNLCFTIVKPGERFTSSSYNGMLTTTPAKEATTPRHTPQSASSCSFAERMLYPPRPRSQLKIRRYPRTRTLQQQQQQHLRFGFVCA